MSISRPTNQSAPLPVRLAMPDEHERVCSFYWEVADLMEQAPFSPSWRREIYPDRSLLEHMIEEKTLHIYEQDGEIAAGVVVTPQHRVIRVLTSPANAHSS